MVVGGRAWLLGGGVRGCSGGGVRGFFSFFRYNEIRSMSGRYASYWNAFLYGHFFRSKMVAIVVGIVKNFRCPKVRRPSNDEKAEDTRIRERLRNLPAWKKDFSERKQRGPMVCIHFCFI